MMGVICLLISAFWIWRAWRIRKDLDGSTADYRMCLMISQIWVAASLIIAAGG